MYDRLAATYGLTAYEYQMKEWEIGETLMKAALIPT